MPETWSLPANRAIPDKLKEHGGKISVSLIPGPKVISHAFRNPARTHVAGNIKASSSIVAQVTVAQSDVTKWDANPMREVVDPNIPARWGIIVMRDVNEPFHNPNSRIFSTVRVDLKPGTHRIEVPLNPALWGSVFGQSLSTKKALWRTIWTNPAFLGICFGGNFYAHGVSVSAGAATIAINTLNFKR